MERDFSIRVQTRSKRTPEGWKGALTIWLPDQRRPLEWTMAVPDEVAQSVSNRWCRTVNNCLAMQQAIVSGNVPAANMLAWRTHHEMGQSAQEIAAAAEAVMPLIREGLPLVTGLLRDIGQGAAELFRGAPDPTRAPAGYVPQGPGDTGALNQLQDSMVQLAAAVKAQADAANAGATPEEALAAAEEAKALVRTAQSRGHAETRTQWEATRGAPTSLPGAGLSLYGAGTGRNPADASPTLGTGALLKTALDTATDSPRLFGQLAPEVAGLLSTSLGMYDRAVLSKLGRGDYSGAIEEAHYDTSRKVANALRIARGLLEV